MQLYIIIFSGNCPVSIQISAELVKTTIKLHRYTGPNLLKINLIIFDEDPDPGSDRILKWPDIYLLTDKHRFRGVLGVPILCVFIYVYMM